MPLQGINRNAPMPSGTRRGSRPPQLAVGKDTLDSPKIFQAAKTGGLKNYYVEQIWDLR